MVGLQRKNQFSVNDISKVLVLGDNDLLNSKTIFI
jgi:hypothetical protein